MTTDSRIIEHQTVTQAVMFPEVAAHDELLSGFCDETDHLSFLILPHDIELEHNNQLQEVTNSTESSSNEKFMLDSMHAKFENFAQDNGHGDKRTERREKTQMPQSGVRNEAKIILDNNLAKSAYAGAKVNCVSPSRSISKEDERNKRIEGCTKEVSRKHWTGEEEKRFLKAMQHFGPKEAQADPITGRLSVRLGAGVAEIISIVVGTRSTAQVRSHVQKHYIRLQREASRRYCLQEVQRHATPF